MNIKITLEEKRVKIIITEKNSIIGHASFSENADLSKNLIKNIDKLLKNKMIPRKKINKINIKSSIPDSYTSQRIISSFKKSFDFSAKNK